ncbi:Phage tail protein [Escherichia coli O25b:H4]|uniref:Phage tail protein n=1 Tax=Escherichia coli O25b:H4 TaxID=941280 RepID=A0A192CM27_ECO25|nr:Phage tail protein [Escherichia coli O25b:H4]
MEDAMKGVAKQVNGLRDDNGNRTARFYEMQDAIKAASRTVADGKRCGGFRCTG